MTTKRPPKGTMLRDVVRVMERQKKPLRDDPKVKELTTLLMAGRASERLDIIEELNRRIEKTPPIAAAALMTFRDWLRDRDERLVEKRRG